MDENPLEISPEREQRIRERAYHLWDSEGRPEGRDLDYWERASELEGMASSAGSALRPNPMVENHGDILPDQPVEEAALMENLGEFPDRGADQGDRVTVPMTKQKAAKFRRGA